jgi:uncharacterized membrane protein HdeD (DUF308 family)
MTAPSLADSIKANATGMTLLGIAMLILGALAVAAPLWTGVAVALLVGLLVLAAGIAQCAFSFQAGSFGQKLLGLLLGLLTAICGVVMVAHPVLHLSFLTLAIAAYFLVAGLFEAISALGVRPLRGWGWILVGGLLSVLLGGFIWAQWPLSGAWAIGVLVGIKVMFLGATMVTLGSASRALAAQTGPST